MTDQESLYAWEAELARRFPQLSAPQARVLALWSFGMILARSCARTAVSTMLSRLLHCKQNTIGQRLREFCYGAEDKRGAQRRELTVEASFAPLLGWVLSLWQGTQLALALDATSLSDRLVVLTISVLYRGCAIPVAWAVVGAHATERWNAHWLRLLKRLGPCMPGELLVLVLTDRGLYSRDLFRAICRLGWHPLMRIQRSGKFRPEGTRGYHAVPSFVPEAGTRWSGRGTAFKNAPLACTLLAWWEAGQDEPWLLVTDLEPDRVAPACYGLRAWIEQGFRTIKRGGWQWHTTRMTDPARAARLWLAIAVATLWVLSVGSAHEDAPEPWDLPSAPLATPPARRRSATRRRVVSLMRQGLSTILVAVVQHAPLPLGWLVPDPWPHAAAGRCPSGP